jgi:hypothetical protein
VTKRIGDTYLYRRRHVEREKGRRNKKRSLAVTLDSEKGDNNVGTMTMTNGE